MKTLAQLNINIPLFKHHRDALALIICSAIDTEALPESDVAALECIQNLLDCIYDELVPVDAAKIKPDHFTRVDNDTNGNPRYVIHFLHCVPLYAADFDSITAKYDAALHAMKRVGGRKFHNKQYGGGIAFVSYSLDETIAHIERCLC